MSNTPLFERRSPLRISYALLILTIFFFCLPAAFQGARLSLGKKENDVKDWLPDEFAETAELEWFAGHFAGEAFVLATWEGCNENDQRLNLLATKLRHESLEFDPAAKLPAAEAESFRRARQIGTELELLQASESLKNWGGQNEKWLTTPYGQWYYIKPDGGLYRWDEPLNGPSVALRRLSRARGTFELTGTLVTAFGKAPGEGADSPEVNPFYNDPSLLSAPLFETVNTGNDIVDQLASEGGPLWPVDLTDPEKRSSVARRLAMQRLSGMLFAPAVPQGFAWTPAAFRKALDGDRAESLPDEFDILVANRLTEILERDFDGSIEQLQAATEQDQSDVWYSVWDDAQVAPPPRLTCVMVTLTDLAKDNLVFAIGRGVMGQPRGRLLKLAEQSGVYAAQPPSMAPPPFNTEPAIASETMPALRLGGPTVDNMAIDEEGTVTLARLVGYSVLLGIVLSYLCFRSVKITIMIFVVGGSSAMLSMGMVWWTGGRVDAILMSMPSLVYVLGLSGAIHVINYYRDEVRIHGQRGAAGRALRHAVIPCSLASFTTAIGLISLFTSNLKPISNFGLYSAIGVMSTLGILFSYLPAALHVFAPKIGEPTNDQTERETEFSTEVAESPIGIWWARIGRQITRHHALVTAACLTLLVVCAVGMKKIETSVQLLELFDSDARIIRDYSWLETHFGKLVPMEVVVRMPPAVQAEAAKAAGTSSPLTLQMLERAEAVSRVHKVVHRTLGEPGLGIVGQATSADTFMPPLPGPSNRRDPVRYTFNQKLIEAGDQLRDNDYLKIEKEGPYQGSELWRISLRVAALSDVDYGQFISTLREVVSPVLTAYETRDQLVSMLTQTRDGEPKFDIGASVLVVGAGRPQGLDKMLLVDLENRAVLHQNTYLATLGELLANEPVRRPEWLNLDPEKASELLSTDRWEKVLDRFDVVIWVGDESYQESDFAVAKNFIDARNSASKQTTPKLLDGRIPSVEGGGSIQAIYTGVIPVVYKAQRTLLTSLADSIGLAFVLIAIVMILLLNPGLGSWDFLQPRNMAYGLAAGAVAMIPNLFPVIMVFGLLCHFGFEIDIGTMMTASVAMGVAVDDTIHYLSWFRANLDQGKSRVEAVIETYRRVGPAMTQTTIVGGLGLFVFALSTFTPTQRFGTLMLVMLLAALLGDLVLLPALLAGPLGRVFKPRRGKSGLPVEPNPGHESVEDATVEVDAKRGQTSSPLPVGQPDSGVHDVPDVIDEPVSSGLESVAEPGVPHLRVHFPSDRTDAPHRTRRS